MSKSDVAALKKQLEAVQAENAALKVASTKAVSLKVSAKGGLSVYGMGRFPITLYREQWEALLGMADSITAFIKANDSTLKRKGQ